MIRVIVLCILALPALAQQDGPLSLGGVVVNEATGEPLPRALVTMMHFGDPEVKVKQWKAFTDSNGRFHFSGLTAGQYSITPQKPEFTITRDAKTRDEYSVNLTASTESLRVDLSPLGVITGNIVDQDGLPGPGVNVIALSMQVQDGLVQITSNRNVGTDDRGVYRLWNLTPGKYYIKVAGSGGGTFLTPANANTGNADESIAAVYFGGGKTLDSAMPVEIAPGSEAHADFTLNVEPAFKIRGRVVNFVQRRPVTFQLLSGSDEVEAIRASVNNDTGNFELVAVVAGSYVLRATQDGNTGETPVTVRSTDVEGVSLALTPPVDIRVNMSGAGSGPAAVQDGDVFRAQPSCIVQLRSAGKLNTFSASNNAGTGAGDREFIRGVPPGRYRVSFSCFSAYARSAMASTHDLAADPILMVEPGVAPPPIDVAVTAGGGRIKGMVAFDGPTANVLLVPQFSSVAGPQMVSAFRVEGDKLQFQAGNLEPGAYIVRAFARPDIEYRNPEFLRTLAGGLVVQVDGDGEKEVTLDGVVP
jgi:uncharacterized protein (DUF2141 family)